MLIEESNFDSTSIVIGTVFLSMIYLLGLYLQIRIIIISKQAQEMTWRSEITHSIIMIIYYAFRILTETLTLSIPNLGKYTGSWFCTLSLFVQLYGMNSILGHSLWIAVHKYVFIKHAKSVYKFGNEKAKHVFCWLHIILPAICAVGWMFRPYYRAIESVNRCHGGLDWQLFDGKLPKYKVKINETSPITIRKMAEKLFFCGLGYYDGNTFYDNFMYVGSQIYCFIQATWACTVVGNILEIFFYLRIFSFMER